MRHKHFTLVIIMLSGLALSFLQAQETVNTSGGNALGSNGTASYSIGQVAYQIHSGTIGTLTEGVQQPYEISLITAIEAAKGINLSVSVYPNPTSYNLTLSIDEFNISNLSYQLYDMQGKLLKDEKITSNQTSIGIGNLISATYYLKVIQNNREIKTFNIIKIK